MHKQTNPICANTCSFAGLKPAMADLPYPPLQVAGQNLAYANLLNIDYCGSVSELSAVTQYINNESRLSYENCPMAKTILSIAVAEMMHLQKLGSLICLLGGSIDYTAKQPNGHQHFWTPQFLTLPCDAGKMIAVGIESEQAAIKQYRMHMRMIQDKNINAVLARIIQDEEYHIMLLRALAHGQQVS